MFPHSRLLRIFLAFAFAALLPLHAQRTPNAPKPPALPTQIVKYDVDFDQRFAVDLAQPYTCTVEKLPTGLTLTNPCVWPLEIHGTVRGTVPCQVTATIKLIHKWGGKPDEKLEVPITFYLQLPLYVQEAGGPPLPPCIPSVGPAPPDFSKIKFSPLTEPIQEGATTISGSLDTQLGDSATKYSVELWIDPDLPPGHAGMYRAPLKPASGTTTLQQRIALDTKSSFTLNPVTPLPPGTNVSLFLVDGNTRLPPTLSVALPAAIPLPSLGLHLTCEIVAGISTITGNVNMPNPAVPPDPKATPPTFGNFPQIVVWLRDADLGLWSQLPLTAADGSSTTFAKSVDPSGLFSVSFKTPLKAGQKVRVDAVPPFGRTFANLGPLPDPPAIGPSGLSITRQVKSLLALVQPSVSTPLLEGTTVLAGVATIPTAGPLSVAVLRVKPIRETPDAGPDRFASVPEDEETSFCITADDLNQFSREKHHPFLLKSRGELIPLNSSGGNSLLQPVGADGTFKLTLAFALKENERIQILQVLPLGTALAGPQKIKCASPVQKVRYNFDWHRTNLNFVAGVLISNSSATSTSSANFSQANQFYSFNLDRAWRLPGADCVGVIDPSPKPTDTNPPDNKPADKKAADKKWEGFNFGREIWGRCKKEGWHANGIPGMNTYFEGRLTSIPVSIAAANPTTASTPGTTTTAATGSLLTSQKVFRISAGVFFPWIASHGAGHHTNGIFFAPLAKAGFDTLTGAGAPTGTVAYQPAVTGPTGAVTTTLNYQTAYNFFAFGGRLGNMELSASHNRAPTIDHYLDVTIGRYSNLQSYICHKVASGQPLTPTPAPASSCVADYPTYFPGTPAMAAASVIDSRKQLFRLDFEGLVKIPVPLTAIPFYIGFNANISQHTVGAETLDHGYAPPDDIRILFGTRIDMGALLTTFKLGAN